jgi:hypothetical protein
MQEPIVQCALRRQSMSKYNVQCGTGRRAWADLVCQAMPEDSKAKEVAFAVTDACHQP